MKPVRQHFEWQIPDGRPYVGINEWLRTLPAEDQKEFQEALQRQHKHRQQAIDDGLMHIDKNGDYIWRDSITGATNKPNDDVWLRYFKRYQEECGLVLKCSFIEE